MTIKSSTFTSKRTGTASNLAMAILGVAVCGCSVGSVEYGSNEAELTWEEFLEQTYHEPFADGVFVLNGDEVKTDERQLREYYDAVYSNGGALIVHQAFGADAKWDANQRHNLTYCVSNGFGEFKDAAIQAMAEATAAWEAAADVAYIYVPEEDAKCDATNEAVVFDVNLVNGQPYLARAFFPNQNRNTRNVLIDQSSFGNLGAITLTGILSHELGHSLGFRHEHTRPESGATQCFEDNDWRPLTDYDQLSVMHYPQCNGVGGRDLSLTALDIQGAQALYGAPGADTPPDPADPTVPTPTPGTPQTGNASGTLNQGQQVGFEGLSVKPGTVFTAIIAGQGDADLYVRFDQAPTRNEFDCRPWLIGSFETCSLDVPAGASSAHVMIDGYTAASFELNVSWVEP